MVRGGCLLLLLHRNGREIEKGREREREGGIEGRDVRMEGI